MKQSLGSQFHEVSTIAVAGLCCVNGFLRKKSHVDDSMTFARFKWIAEVVVLVGFKTTSKVLLRV